MPLINLGISQHIFVLNCPQTHLVEVAGTPRKVEFNIGEFPNDMKMLAFLAGKLNNAALYFSTFGNVNTKDAAHAGTFGNARKNKVCSGEYVPLCPFIHFYVFTQKWGCIFKITSICFYYIF